jgi:hypothetical protein
VITPDNKANWHPVTQAAPFDAGNNGAAAPNSASPSGASPSANPPITPPEWAR